MTGDDSQAGNLKLFDLTEEQFIALPEARRAVVQEQMLAKMRVLREVTREIDHRASNAWTAGDRDEAITLLQYLKRVGGANRGAGVTKVVELAGKAVEELVDQRLAEYRPGSK